ncbi:MAG: sensor histidine kinase [Actinomycetota bacterium]|nr:MAG: sensor histidine kinase [Actinomycetota bacterium]
MIGRTDQNVLPGSFLSKEQAGQVLRLPNGRNYRAGFVSLPGDTSTASSQVIFEDITEEHRESRRATLYAALVVEADEDRRRRLSREHLEEPLQLLLHLARRLESLGGSDVPSASPQALGDDRSQALEAAARLKTIARELRPKTLDDLGLVAALSGLLADVDEETDLTTEIQVVGEAVRLAPEVELGAFRIIQEAVRNTIRHARANRLYMSIVFRTNELQVTVADDGCGFTLGDLDDQMEEHLGLLSMGERAKLLGGDVQLRSEPGAGTVIEARVPLGPLTATGVYTGS